MRSLLRWPLCAILVIGASGCALLGKSDALAPRYFSPDLATATAAGSKAASGQGATALELRLGRITAASYLGERIVFRDSNYELNFYEERRWTERPEAYLRRALSQALFQEHGLQRIVSGAGPTLDVELIEFAELRLAQPKARVRATYVLSDNRLVRREATVTVELPFSSDPKQASPTPAVRAMSAALSNAVNQIVDQVLAELREGPATANAAVDTPMPAGNADAPRELR
jgi:cholesterol transport system auxiliary component